MDTSLMDTSLMDTSLMDTNTKFQQYLNHISPDLSYKLIGLTLLLLHPDFVVEIDLKTDKMTVYTLGRQRINELDIEVIYDLCKNVGIISSYLDIPCMA